MWTDVQMDRFLAVLIWLTSYRRLAILRQPKIISLVFDVFICMLLPTVQDRTESKICGWYHCCETWRGYQFRQHSVINVLMWFAGSSQVVDHDNKWQRSYRREPCGMLPFNDFQEETYRWTLTRCRRHDKHDPNHCKMQFVMLNDFSLVIKMLWSTRSKAFLKLL